MFTNKGKRYLTKGIDTAVPKEIQLLCWELVDQLVKENNVVIDYMQIMQIKFDNEEGHLKIIHRQENQYYRKKYEIKLKEVLSFDKEIKIWLIDDGSVQTMLLPEEY